MPPKRRSSGPVLKPNKSSQQPQLLFKNGQNRVTKPSSASTASKKSPKKVKTRPSAIGDDDSLATAVETQEVELEGQGGLTTAEIAIEDQATAQHSQIESQSLTKEEEEAQRIARETDQKRLKQYWQRKEAERLAPRVHQEGLTLNEKIMREFDMSGHFGPCIGIARSKRWRRAQNLGLKPPIEVLAVLMQERERQNLKAERAHVDELLSSRSVVET